MKNLQFSPSLIPTMVTLIIFSFLILLGVWQLNRADEKRGIDDNVLKAQNKQALNLNDTSWDSLVNEIHRKASVTGVFDKQHQFLRDNQTNKGKPGYHVLTPLLLNQYQIESNQWGKGKATAVLVNRGWIPYKGKRENIPDIAVTEELLTLKGSIKKPGRSFILKQEEKITATQTDYPRVIQSISLDEFGNSLSYTFLPIIIELDKTESKGFIRDWQPYYGSADKHIAYAFQWFAMAAILVILFIKMNLRRINDS